MLIYITVMLKPLFPIICDWYEHEFNSIQHEIQVHMVYGNNHLEKNLAERNSGDHHNKNHSSVKSEDQVPFHVLVSEYKNEHSSILSNTQFNIVKFLKRSTVVIPRDGPPPKFT